MFIVVSQAFRIGILLSRLSQAFLRWIGKKNKRALYDREYGTDVLDHLKIAPYSGLSLHANIIPFHFWGHGNLVFGQSLRLFRPSLQDATQSQ